MAAVEGEGPSAPEVFAYTPEDFVRDGVGWPGGEAAASPFDRALRRAWEDRRAQGLFRYRLAEGALPTRRLPGPAGLVAQLNPRRASERRAPQAVRSVRQGFEAARFHFGRLRAGEVLFALGGAGGPQVAINASPLEFGHVLLVPAPGRGLPQVLTAEALAAGLEALLLSAHPGFRLGFNSLGAGASVNHLHLHAFYLAHPLPGVEAAPCRPLLPAAGLHLLPGGDGVPAPGLLFYSDGRRGPGALELARRVARLTDDLARREIAHNLFATRGAAPQGGPAGARPGLRVVLWPRRACFVAEREEEEAEAAPFHVALCELAGYLPLRTARDFETLTEAEALRLIRRRLLPEPDFARLLQELVALLEEEE